MEFRKLKNQDSAEFRKAWRIYELSFPPDERRDLESQKAVLRNNLYRFFAVFKDNELVAIITDWNLGDFFLIEHLAVENHFQGEGIGTRLLKEYLSKKKQKIVLEAERPETEIAAKRIGFYERIGFKLNNFDYIQPPYSKDKKPISMFLMTYPKKINESEFSSMREKLHTIVYGLEKPFIGG